MVTYQQRYTKLILHDINNMLRVEKVFHSETNRSTKNEQVFLIHISFEKKLR